MPQFIYFGTDGIRAHHKALILQPSAVRKIGYTLGKQLREKGLGAFAPEGSAPILAENFFPGVVIGRDTRQSGEAIVQQLTEGLGFWGFPVLDCAVTSTPALAYALRSCGAPVGIMVTASHNPAEYNGLKFFTFGGQKINDAAQSLLEEGLQQGEPLKTFSFNPLTLPEALPAWSADYLRKLGNPSTAMAGAYQSVLRSILAPNALQGWKLVVDAAHGGALAHVKAVLTPTGADIVYLGDQPSGTNINEGCGSECLGALTEAVLHYGADLGIALDGDGDRVCLCDNTGRAVPGELFLAALARWRLAHRGTLAEREDGLKNNSLPCLVTTVQSNRALDAYLRPYGIEVQRVGVGDRGVSEAIQAAGSQALLGGEASGHFIFPEHLPCGDGLFAALAYLQAYLQAGPLTELASASGLGRIAGEVKKESALGPGPLWSAGPLFSLFPSAHISIRVSAQPPLPQLPHFWPVYQHFLKTFADGKGALLVRYSGTEPKLRLSVEAQTLSVAQETLARLLQALLQEGVVAESDCLSLLG